MTEAEKLIYKMSQDILASPDTSEEAKKEARIYLHVENMKAMRETIASGIDLSFTMSPMEREAFEINCLKRYNNGE